MGLLDFLRHPATVKAPPPPTLERVTQRKLYLYPDYLNPTVATDPDLYSAIRLGTLVHGPGASDMVYRAWHGNDLNSAVYACLTAIATAYPEAPAKVFVETDPGTRDELPDHPLKQLLDHPNIYLTREDLLHYTTWAKHVTGNAYWRKIRSGGPGSSSNVVQLWPISPARIQPVTTKEDAEAGIFISWYAYTYEADKDPERIPPEDIVHFRLGIDDRDNRIGMSPLARLVAEVAGDVEAHKWQEAMLLNGGTAGMLVTVPIDSSITMDQAEEMKVRFEDRFSGDNRGRTGVLMGGATAQPYGFSPEQMDMKSLHRIPEERIAAVLRVPAIIAGLGAGLDRSTYANFREAREMFTEMTILPLYAFDAATLNQQLLPEFSTDPHTYIAFDTSDLRALQEDMDAKYRRLNEAVKTGWIRPNEARTDVGLPPDMDDNAPLPGQIPPALPQNNQQQDAAPAGQKQGEYVSKVLQSLVDNGLPGLQADLDEYFDGQRQRVKSALVNNA